MMSTMESILGLSRKLLALLLCLGIASPSWATFSLGNNATAQGAVGYTSGNVDTTGADLIIVVCAENSASACSLSDNQSNTWLNAPPTRYPLFGLGIQIQYALCSGKTSATHTFTSDRAGSISIMAFSGVGASPFDQENGTYNNTVQPGSLTPSQDNELVVSGWTWNTPGVTVTSVTGMTLVNQIDAGAMVGVSGGYVIQTTAGAINPTWNYTGSPGFFGTSQASFKAGAGVVASGPQRRIFQGPIFYR